MSISGTGAIGHAGPHEPELLDLIAAIQPVTARVPAGNHHVIPVLPSADRGDGDTNHPRHGADAIDRPTGSAHQLYPTRRDSSPHRHHTRPRSPILRQIG